MSNYREYPPPELRAAMDWLKEKEESEVHTLEVHRHYVTLRHHLQELILTYHNYIALCRYRASTEARNVLAKQMYERMRPPGGREVDWPELARRCLAAADTFLEQSGEKKVVAEQVEEALREVLGWKP